MSGTQGRRPERSPEERRCQDARESAELPEIAVPAESALLPGTHPVRLTRGELADGREILFFDDTEPHLSGKKLRAVEDPRPLPPRALPPHDAAAVRTDPLTGDPVALAAHRMNRTFLPPADEDPLAPAGQGTVPSEVPEQDYDVVVFENRFPSLQGPVQTLREEPLFAETTAGGRCEVVCFTADREGTFAQLGWERARTVVEAWTHRTQELTAQPGVVQVVPFENRGEEIGVTLHHPHGQIYAYPYLPPMTASVQRQAAAWRQRTGGDLLQDVLEAELAAGERIVYAGEQWVAYVPWAAKWPVELMMMPRRAVRDFTELTDAEKDELATVYLEVLGRLDRFFEGVDRLPYIAAWHQVPVRGGEAISRMRLHVFSVLRAPGKLKYLAGSESAMGAWISDTTPERIAARFRELGETGPGGGRPAEKMRGGQKPMWREAPTPQELTERAQTRYAEAFGRKPEAVFSAPGRVNLLGEHIDYSGGTVMPLALPHRTAVAVGVRPDRLLRAVSGHREDGQGDAPVAVDLDAVGPVGSPGAVTGWVSYVAGVPWAMQAEGLIHRASGMDVAVESAVPVGAGLSSSAALECAVALAVDAAAQRGDEGALLAASDAGRTRLAAACVRAENEMVGASTGGMDQSIALRAQEGTVLSIDCRDFSSAPVYIDMAGAGLALLVIDTRAPHRLVDGQYAARRSGCDAAARLLGVGLLREALGERPDARQVQAALDRFDAAAAEVVGEDEVLSNVAGVRRLVRHAWSEMARVQECVELFAGGSPAMEDPAWRRLGELLDASHASLAGDYAVSCRELDVAVEAARKAGALGARMTGGGFGGSAIALVPQERVDAVACAVDAAFQAEGLTRPEFLVASPAGSAHRER